MENIMSVNAIKNPKVLIVDDDIITRMLIRASVTQWGFPVIEASDGEKAFDILQENDPPLIIIVDWMMPNEDGIMLCERIKKQLPIRPYIILVTHNRGLGNQIKAIEAGADAFLNKPINYEELKCQMLVGTRTLANNNTNINFGNLCEIVHNDLKEISKIKKELTNNFDSLKNSIQEPNIKMLDNFKTSQDAFFKAIETLEKDIQKLDEERNHG